MRRWLSGKTLRWCNQSVAPKEKAQVQVLVVSIFLLRSPFFWKKENWHNSLRHYYGGECSAELGQLFRDNLCRFVLRFCLSCRQGPRLNRVFLTERVKLTLVWSGLEVDDAEALATFSPHAAVVIGAAEEYARSLSATSKHLCIKHCAVSEGLQAVLSDSRMVRTHTDASRPFWVPCEYLGYVALFL